MSASASAALCCGKPYIRSRLKLVNARGVQLLDRAPRLGGAVDAAEALQLRGVEALRAQ